jgi:hypothetical protein
MNKNMKFQNDALALAQYLREFHRGRENRILGVRLGCISDKDLDSLFESGRPDVLLCRMTHWLQSQGIPVLALAGKKPGYFWGIREDEIRAVIKSRQKRALAVMAPIRGLKKLLRDGNQINLFSPLKGE